VVIESSDFSITDGMRDVSGFGIASRPQLDKGLSENNIGFTERVFSAAGAAVLSAVTLNPLDVVKVGAFYCCLDSSGKLYLLTGEDLMFLL
jgi:solute carrier family 25 protein 39/40